MNAKSGEAGAAVRAGWEPVPGNRAAGQEKTGLRARTGELAFADPPAVRKQDQARTNRESGRMELTGSTREVKGRFAARLLLLGLLGLSAMALQARGGAAERLFFGVLSAVSVWCWVVPYLSVGRISAERFVTPDGGTAVDGGSLRVKLTLRMSRPLPLLWLAVRDELAYPDGESGRTLVFRSLGLPGFARELTIEYGVSGLHRGEIAIRPVQVAAGDPLGLTVRSFVVPCESRMLVRPSPPLPGMPGGMERSLVPGGQRTSVHGPPRGAAGAPAIGAASATSRPGAGPDSRIYAPGDPLRRVDWRAMARGAGLQTRLDDREPPAEEAVLLDVSAGSYGGDRRLFDASAGSAAGALQAAAASGRGVSLLLGAPGLPKRYVGAGDQAAYGQAVDTLARLHAEKEAPLADAIAEASLALPRGSVIVCLTAGLPPEGGGKAGAPGHGGTGNAVPQVNRGSLEARAKAGSGASAARGGMAENHDAPEAGAKAGVGASAASAGMAENRGALEAGAKAGGGASAADAGAAVDRDAAAGSPGVGSTDGPFVRALKIAALRGVRLDLRISCNAGDEAAAAAHWNRFVKGTGCTVTVLPVPESYRREPEIFEGGGGYAGVTAS
ncbi:DUF58 domain-containing protein [Paenibacillus humicola]|uniref:DUF58 domain-containing protein n=1 Tax=Paenibacillus humicola TaxID=3110540 RepID=UPI00237B2F53|nr:DUF58 domain-containing protein [Paenibacillus humicola]